MGSEVIKENCNFTYYFNKTDIKPAVSKSKCSCESVIYFNLGSEIIAENWYISHIFSIRLISSLQNLMVGMELIW